MWAAFDGLCASQGFDPLEMPWDRFLNLSYWFLTRNGDEESIAKFDRWLWVPFDVAEEVPAESPWSVESQEAAMAAFGKEFEVMGSTSIE